MGMSFNPFMCRTRPAIFERTEFSTIMTSISGAHLDEDYSLCRSQSFLVFLHQLEHLDLAGSMNAIDRSAIRRVREDGTKQCIILRNFI